MCFALLFVVFGCSGSKPHPMAAKTVPVSGRLVDSQGAPISKGMVEFRSSEDPEKRAIGEVGADGRFSLYMIVDSQKLNGALPGQYDVSFIPFSQDQVTEASNSGPKTLKKKYVVAAGEETLEVKLE